LVLDERLVERIAEKAAGNTMLRAAYAADCPSNKVVPLLKKP